LVVMHALNEYLLRRHAEGRQVVVFVEESQSMPIATLEEIRLLSNLETKQHKLLQIVLFGQPELDDNLRRADIRQLRERITHSFSLSPLNAEEVRAYLAFRLKAAGYVGQDLFNRSAVAYLTHSTGGLTRRINIVADKSLLAAFAENTHTITRKHLRAAVHDSEFSGPSRYRQSRHWLYPAAAVLGALAIGVLIYFHEHGLSADGQQQAEGAPAKTAAAQENDQGVRDPTTQPDRTNGTSPVITESSLPQRARKAEISRTTSPRASAQASHPEKIEPLKLTATLSTSNDLLEQRLLATDRWLADSGVTTYSIQLLGSNDPALLKRYFETLGKFIEIERVFVYRTVANQQPSMTVLYGAFNTRPEAVKSLEALPGELKINRPYIRTVQGIRTEIGLKKPS
ncbi:MAG: AAA family ATPase, partial [Betaproteobacteria bacterium]